MLRKNLLLTLIILLSAHNHIIADGWGVDILSPRYEQLRLEQESDYRGEVFATLVRRTPALESQQAVLYLHGYNDYFFQQELAERFNDAGYNFYALDLRGYGRSIIEGQTPFEVRALSEYFEDIDDAIAEIIKGGNSQITLVGHSTGGLILSLYCSHNPNSEHIKALVLNSPFLDMNLSPFVERFIIPIVSFIGRFFPNLVVTPGNNATGAYAKSLLKEHLGEWEFDLDKKFPHDLDVTAGWIRAIHLGHKELQRGAAIPYPILVMRSNNSVLGGEWTPQHKSSDSVLCVEDIARYTPALGENSTLVTIDGALHDIILSSPEVRENAYSELFKWLNSCVYIGYE